MAAGKNFAIVRVAKVSGKGMLSAASQHNLRERETPNADPERTHENAVAGAGTTNKLLDRWQEQLEGVRTQTNSVSALEYLITYTPGAFKDDAVKEERYFNKALDWVKEKHGKQNVLQAAIHRDEHSPHMHVLVVPIRERADGTKVLSAKHYVDGKALLSRIQTDFHQRVGQEFSLERGIEGSRARHSEVQRFYGFLEKGGREDRPGPKPEFETKDFLNPKAKFEELDEWHKGRLKEKQLLATKEIFVAEKMRSEVEAGRSYALELSRTRGMLREYQEALVRKDPAEMRAINEHARESLRDAARRGLEVSRDVREILAKDQPKQARERDRGGFER